jgi:hypothetical protein
MSPQPPTVLDELWESIPTGPAPVDDLVNRGRARRHRRRLGVVGGAAALAIAAVVTLSMAPWTHGDEDHVLTPPPGTRYVGIGRVVVAVPEDWADGAASCNSPTRDTVFFPWPQDCALGGRPGVSSLAISSLPFQETGASRAEMKVTTEVDGNPVLESGATCTRSDPGICRQSFGIPDLHAFFTVTSVSPNGVSAIRGSLRVLPDGQSTVPFVTKWGDWRAAFRQVGLEVRVRHQPCPGSSTCLGPFATTPAAGHVVPTGSTVTIEVLDS